MTLLFKGRDEDGEEQKKILIHLGGVPSTRTRVGDLRGEERV